MPQLPCPCGFVHNLSPIPDDAWLTIRDVNIEAYEKFIRVFQDGFNSPERSPEREQSNRGLREASKMKGRLYECPDCGRLMWRKARGQEYRVFRLETQDEQPQPIELAHTEPAATGLGKDEFRCFRCKSVVPAN